MHELLQNINLQAFGLTKDNHKHHEKPLKSLR